MNNLPQGLMLVPSLLLLLLLLLLVAGNDRQTDQHHRTETLQSNDGTFHWHGIIIIIMAGKLSCLIRDPPQKSALFPQHETATGGGGHHVKFIRISMLLVGTRVSQVHTTYTGHQPPTVNVLRRGSHKCSLEWKYSPTQPPTIAGKGKPAKEELRTATG